MPGKQRQLFMEAQSRLNDRDWRGAMSVAERGLAVFPEDGNLMCIAARAAIALGLLDEAKRHADAAVRRYPDYAQALDVHGDIRLVEGRPREAIDTWERALQLEPGSKTLPLKIGKARAMLGPVGSHAGMLREALEHEGREEYDRAEEIYRDILKSDPDHVEAARLLAAIAVRHEQHREALVFLQHAVEIAPDYSRALVDLANVHRQLDEFENAESTARKVVALSPEKAEAYMLLAGVLGSAGRHEDAIEMYSKVLELDPGKSGAMCSMAHHLKTIGRQSDAVAHYRDCIATQADHAEAYWSLANLKTFRFRDEEVDAMRALLRGDGLPDESRAQLHNALGFAYEARRDYDSAFHHFEQCNIIRRRAEHYDPVDTESTNDRLIEIFSARFLQRAAAPPVEPTPIFVVGLPRSGSTLIEQILASHSQVEGTHELHELSKSVRDVRGYKARRAGFPDFLQNISATGLAKIAKTYMDTSAKYRNGAPYFIDKNPNNFVFAGLIRLAMPNAKIINARRHPLDSCFGAYKQLFASGQPFTYDLLEIGEYYLQYQRIMDHWHEVLPGFILDVHYEDVVADLEAQVRRMLDFCGLEFEASCLHFHETERAVKTASSEQVRQPIYETSVGLWRNYELHLGLLIDILAPLSDDDRGNTAGESQFQSK